MWYCTYGNRLRDIIKPWKDVPYTRDAVINKTIRLKSLSDLNIRWLCTPKGKGSHRQRDDSESH